MNAFEKELLRAQFAASYFRHIKGSPGAFVCLYCGGVSHQNPSETYVNRPPPKPTVKNLIPRKHSDDCPVAAKIKELEL